MGITEGEEAVKEAKEFIEEKRYDLKITDVPISTLKLFKDLANSDEFKCSKSKYGHYGFCLKFLVDNYMGVITTGVSEAHQRIDDLEEQFASMQPVQTEEKKITMCNGSILRTGG